MNNCAHIALVRAVTPLSSSDDFQYAFPRERKRKTMDRLSLLPGEIIAPIYANGNLLDDSIRNIAGSIRPRSEDVDDPFWINLCFDVVEAEIKEESTLRTNNGSYLCYLRPYDKSEYAFDYLKPFVGLARSFPVLIHIGTHALLAYRRTLSDSVVEKTDTVLTFTRHDKVHVLGPDPAEYESAMSKYAQFDTNTLMCIVRSMCDPYVAQDVLTEARRLLQRLLGRREVPSLINPGTNTIAPTQSVVTYAPQPTSINISPYAPLVQSPRQLRAIGRRTIKHRTHMKWAQVLGISIFHTNFVHLRGELFESVQWLLETVSPPDDLQKIVRNTYSNSQKVDQIINRRVYRRIDFYRCYLHTARAIHIVDRTPIRPIEMARSVGGERLLQYKLRRGLYNELLSVPDDQCDTRRKQIRLNELRAIARMEEA